ncbi:COG1470 family protein [Natrinema ejinorense]|uniref:Uncharacterized protein n=1 Tax=Natrinema ejinorense TaxID=373386 RepID=A0A2A5QWA5_9EURY|nr:BGTF surface domain-containing protein [Natrinema ejinorense]PCR91084.1 hypothetical protein CP557_11430 [Natrinema ejinorense]
MTTTRKQLIGITLSLMMVLSVFAAVPVSAQESGANASLDASVDDATVAPGEEVEITYTLENTGDEDGTATGIELSELPSDWDVTSDSSDWQSGSQSWLSTSETVAAGESYEVSATVTVDDNAADGDYDIAATGFVTPDSSDDATVTITVDSSDGDDGDDGDDSDEEDSDEADVSFDDTSDLAGDLVWSGQEVRVGGFEAGDTVVLRKSTGDSSSDPANQLTADEDGYITFDTSGEETGQYFIDDRDNMFDILVQEFDTAEFEADSVDDTTDDFELEFESRRAAYNINVSADGLDVEELEHIFGDDFDISETYDDDEIVTLEDVEDDTYETNFTNIDADEYTFDFEVTDTTAEASDTVNVTESDGADRSIDGNPTGAQGDNVVIPIDTDGTDSSVMQVGDHEENNYEIGLDIDSSDYDEDQFGISMNTYIAGTTEDEANVFNPIYLEGEDAGDVIDDVDVEVAYTNVTEDGDGPLGERLGDGEYLVNIGNDWESTPEDNHGEIDDEQDTGFLYLNERAEPGALAAHTAPNSDSVDNLEDFEDDDTTVTQTSTIAQEDHLLVTVEDLGMTGVFANTENGDDVTEELANAGVSFEMEQAEPGTNRDPQVLNLTAADDADQLNVVAVNGDDYNGSQLILVVEDAGNNLMWDDEDYTANLTITEDNPYIDDEDDEVSSETNITLEERDIEWTDSAEEVPATDGATIEGDTNVAPGTELRTRVRAEGTFTDTADGMVMSDGGDRYFVAEYDFGDYEPGTEFTLRASDVVANNGAGENEIDSVLIEATEPQPFNYDVSTDPAEPVPGDDVSGTVTAENTNDDTVTENVQFVFDGDELYNDTVELEGGASETIVDATLLENASAGDYEWELIVDGESEKDGTLTVEKDPGSDDSGKDDSGSDDSGSDDSGSDDSGSDDSGSDDSGSDDSGDDTTPGFGVGVALVALLGAAMLALRRQN